MQHEAQSAQEDVHGLGEPAGERIHAVGDTCRASWAHNLAGRAMLDKGDARKAAELLGFVVEKDTEGMEFSKQEDKIALRVVQNVEQVLGIDASDDIRNRLCMPSVVRAHMVM